MTIRLSHAPSVTVARTNQTGSLDTRSPRMDLVDYGAKQQVGNGREDDALS